MNFFKIKARMFSFSQLYRSQIWSVASGHRYRFSICNLTSYFVYKKTDYLYIWLLMSECISIDFNNVPTQFYITTLRWLEVFSKSWVLSQCLLKHHVLVWCLIFVSENRKQHTNNVIWSDYIFCVFLHPWRLDVHYDKLHCMYQMFSTSKFLAMYVNYGMEITHFIKWTAHQII